MNINLKEAADSLIHKGFYVFFQDIPNLECILKKAKLMCDQYNSRYSRGGNYWADFPDFDREMASLIYSEDVNTLYNKNMGCPVKNVCITYENNSDTITRNNFLHFDRSRCFKVMTYLSEVGENCGPFSVVEGSHNKGAELRRSFAKERSFEKKRNRIDIDYPEIEYNITPILGPAGTTILFDSDIFHKGGDVTEGGFRCIVRSQWFGSSDWRASS